MATSYLRTHLINDLILTFVLIITAYCWYEIFGDKDNLEDQAESELAELVPINSNVEDQIVL